MNKINMKQILKVTLSVAILSVISKTFFPTYSKTNEVYLKELIQNGTLEKTADLLVDKFSEENPNLDATRLQETKLIVSTCLKSKGNDYLKSGDNYLKDIADKNSPDILAKKLLTECNVI